MKISIVFLGRDRASPLILKHLLSPGGLVLPLWSSWLGRGACTGAAARRRLRLLPCAGLWQREQCLQVSVGGVHGGGGTRTSGPGPGPTKAPPVSSRSYAFPSNKTESRKQGCLFNCNQICRLKSACSLSPAQRGQYASLCRWGPGRGRWA